MQKLTHTFNTRTRQELVEFITVMTRAISPEQANIETLPFMASITGTANAGKSLFWDQMKDTLLDAPQKDASRSRSAANNGRIYETWHGVSKKTQSPTRIFFCNSQAMYIMGKDTLRISEFRRQLAIHSSVARKENPPSKEDLAPFACDSPKQFGDIILWSNEDMAVDIQIRLTSPYEMDLHRWNRKIELQTRNPELKKSPKFQGFLNHYCEMA